MTETTTPRPADFDAYWAAVDDELSQYPAAPVPRPENVNARIGGNVNTRIAHGEREDRDGEHVDR